MRRGFTLIELLVVIAIIALLIGILLPSLGAARKSAWSVVELQNMRQLAVASALYNDDQQDYFSPVQETVFLPATTVTVNTPFGPQTQTIGGGASEHSFRSILWEYYSRVAEVLDSPAERVYQYSDGLSAEDLRAAAVANRTLNLAPGTAYFGLPGPGELFNRGAVGANGWHYWRFPGWDRAKREGLAPFGRAEPNYSGERLARATEVQDPATLVLFGGGSDHRAYPEDTWWIYRPVDGRERFPGWDRFRAHQVFGSERWAMTYEGRGAYAYSDASAKLVDPRDILCNFDVCHWSVFIDAHQQF